MENKRDSMIFYRSFYESLKGLSPIICAEVYDAIFSYGLDFIEPEFKEPIAKAMFTLIKPQLDANIKRYENGNKPKKSKTEAKQKLNESEKEANENNNVNVNDNVNNNENKLLKKVNKTIEERKNDFQLQLSNIIGYSVVTSTEKDFFEYWTEKNQKGTKMRFEMEKVFDIQRRLNTWKKNNLKFNSNTTKSNETRTNTQELAKQQFRERFNQ